jgi:hypothetical protein
VSNTHRRHNYSNMIVLIMAVTTFSFAQTQFMPGAVGKMVLCAGDGPEIVVIDADGQPVQGSDVCVDCMAHFVNFDSEYKTELKLFMKKFSDFVPVYIGINLIWLRYDGSLSRAPPHLVPA